MKSPTREDGATYVAEDCSFGWLFSKKTVRVVIEKQKGS